MGMGQTGWSEALYRNPAAGISAPGANTDAISDLTWTADYAKRNAIMRVCVQLATGSVFNVMRTRGGTEKTLATNANSALAAGAYYVFDICDNAENDVINFQVETDSAFDALAVFAVTQA